MGKLWDPGEKYYSRVYKNNRRWPQEKAKPSGWAKKALFQTGISLLIFLFIWGVFQFNGPIMNSFQARIKGWFTEDYSIEPVIKFFSDIGLWGDTLERAGYDVMKNEEKIPLTIPVSGQIIRSQINNDGIIIAAPEGTPIRAAQEGKVAKIANDQELGRIVEIVSNNGYTTVYAHCNEILVNLNDEVLEGQVIAKVGKTGNADNSQLYFKIINDGKALDPVEFFIPIDQDSNQKT